MLNTRDKSIASVLVSETINTAGWEIIEEMIDREIDLAVEKLKVENFEDLREVTAYQERIRTLKTLKIKIKKIIEGK